MESREVSHGQEQAKNTRRKSGTAKRQGSRDQVKHATSDTLRAEGDAEEMRPDCSKQILDQNNSALLQEMLRNHHVGCCGLMSRSGHDKTTLQQPQQRHSKQTHRHELALCHDVTLDMIHPWVPFDTHNKRVPESGGSGRLTYQSHAPH